MVDTPQNDKTPIELSVGGVESMEPSTRAVITDEISGRMKAFKENTSLYMLMQSDYVGTPADANKTPKVTRTIMFALPQTDNTKTESDVNYSASNEYGKFVRFWDDTYARDAAISIVAACTPGMGAGVDQKAWRTGGDAAYANQLWTDKVGGASYPSIAWPIGETKVTDQSVYTKDKKNQDVSYIKNQDLCFSNNLNDYSSEAKGNKGDRRLKFNTETKKFDKGHLIFYHALSKLTFRFVMGEGFTDDEFKFKDSENALLKNFYSSGTFNLEDGEFVFSTLKKANGVSGQNPVIEKIYQRTNAELTDAEKSAYKYILDALVIPGTDLTSSDDAVFFTINNNDYKVTMSQLYKAILEVKDADGNYIYSTDGTSVKTDYLTEYKKLKAGVHYVFTFNVAKSKISGITASVVDWETVTSDNIIPSNARISLKLEERGTEVKSDAAFYRALDPGNTTISDTYEGYKWTTGYSKSTGASYNSGDKKWTTTDWLWPDNTTFYHFRALAPTTQTVTTATNDYTSLTAGQTYIDVRWGAPILDDAVDEVAGSFKLYYNTTNGFDATGDGSPNSSHQIYKAIGPTNDPIKLIMFHMMSDVTINVESVTGDAAVQLKDGENLTKLRFEKIYQSGKVAMGNGLVSTDGDITNTTSDLYQDANSTDDKKIWKYGAIPQSLENVVLVITTPDKNEYRIAMKDVVCTAPNYSNVSYPAYTDNKVNYWYPGVQYTYNFKLSKKKIESITATILGWESITAGDDNVQIK